MLNACILFAQDAGAKVADKAAEKAAEQPIWNNPMFLMIGLMVLFFFIVILPAQRRQRKEAEALMSSMKKNDEVVTASGIIGIVANIKDTGDEVTLKIDDNARIRVLKSSIVRIVKKDESKDAAAPQTPPATTPNTNIKPNA